MIRLCRRTRGLLLTATTLAAIGPASAAAQAPTVLATVGAVTPITAFGDVVAWSEQDPSRKRYRLRVIRNGQPVAVGVPARAIPFDVDAGPGTDGQPVLVYSRCRKEPTAVDGGTQLRSHATVGPANVAEMREAAVHDASSLRWLFAASCQISVAGGGSSGSSPRGITGPRAETDAVVFAGGAPEVAAAGSSFASPDGQRLYVVRGRSDGSGYEIVLLSRAAPFGAGRAREFGGSYDELRSDFDRVTRPAAQGPLRFVRTPLVGLQRIEDENGKRYNAFTVVVRTSRRLKDRGMGALEAQVRLDGARGDEGLRRTGAASSHCYEQTIDLRRTYPRAVAAARVGDRLAVELRSRAGGQIVQASARVVSESQLRRTVFGERFGCRRGKP